MLHLKEKRQQNQKSAPVTLNCYAERWGSDYVARTEVSRFSERALNPKTLANLDAQGLGPKGRIRIGRKVLYPVHELIKWMEERAEVL